MVNNRITQGIVGAGAIVIAGSICGTVQAAPATVDVFAGTRFSDNINKSEQAPQEEFEHRIGIGVTKRTDPGPCESALSGDVAFLTYQRDVFDDQVSATLDLNAHCQPNPYFRWNLRDTLRDVRTASSAPDTPGNRERRNVFATGPSFTWPATRRDMLFLNLEYQMTRFERSTQDDSDRYTATTGWTRQLSTRWQAGVSASRSDIDIRRTEEELTQENVNVNFSRRDRNSVFSGQIGHTWLTTEIGPFSNTTSGLTGQLRYAHDFEAGTNAYIEGRRSLTDSSTDVDIEIDGLVFNLTETSAVEVTGVSAGLSQQLPQQTQLGLDLSYTESYYVQAGTREERYRANGSLRRALRPMLGGRFNISYVQEDFDQGDGLIQHTYGSSFGLDYRQTQDLSWDAAVGLEKRDITGGPGNRYLEQWISIRVTWNLR